MLRFALALVFLAAMPAAASAAPFGELPPQPVDNPARCLRATGAPGEVVRWAPEGAEFLQATASGFGAPVKIALGDSFLECPTATAQPSGAAVVVEKVDDGIGFAVREPGGAWGPTRMIADRTGHIVDDAAAAVSPRGDVAVAWTETSLRHGDLVARVLAMRRPAGGTFGAPIELQKPAPYLSKPRAELGMQDDGTLLALWNRPNPTDEENDFLQFATAAPGAPFGPAQRLSSKLELHNFSLTVAPDGRALAIADEGAHTRVLERAPGGAFARVADLGYTQTLIGRVAVALRPDGAAIVAWQDLLDVQVFAIRRNGPGPFGRPERVGAKPENPYGPDLPDFVGDAPDDELGRALSAAFAGDGRPVLTWAPGHTLGQLDWTAATVATFPGGVQALSGPVRDADSITPVMLADGTPAVAWSDVADGGDPGLHLAIEGAPAVPEPAAPRVQIGRIRQIHQGLAVPFSCSAACDVRAAVPDGVFARRSLRAAGSGRLEIVPDSDPIVLERADSLRVEVVSGAPGARTATRRTLTAKLRVPPVPPLLGITAVRRAKNQVLVSWHTDRPLRHASILGVGATGRAPEDPFFASAVKGVGRTRFHLRVEAFRDERYVQLYLFYEPDATGRRIAVVRIT